MRITYDWRGPDEPPEAGDVLVTSRSRYLIVAARQVRSRVARSRWALEVKKLAEGEFAPGRRLELVWAPRGPRSQLA